MLFPILSHGQLVTTTDPNLGVTAMGWNDSGALTSRTDAANKTTTLVPDSLGRITQMKDPLNNATTIVYDGKDRMTSIQDPFNNTTSFAYDPAGRRTDVTTPRGTTHYDYDGEGRVLKTTDPLGNKTSTTYDSAGNVLTRTDARGDVTTYEYDAIGRVTRMTDANGGVWRYDYCGALGGGGGASCSSCSGGAGGTFCTVIDPNGNTLTQKFDVMGRVSLVTDSLGHTMAYEFDLAGRKLSETDANGNQTQFHYDEAGRLAKVTEATGAETTYRYDKNGNKISQKDANGHEWTFSYDALNRIKTEVDPLLRPTSYTYDDLGNLATKTDAKNQTLTYQYQIHRLLHVVYPDASQDSFVYDALGRRTSMSNANASTTYAYDNLNRITSTAQTRTGNVATTFNYTYDAAGNITTMTKPGSTVKYGYDGKNRLITLEDALFGTFRFEYDAMDRRTALEYPNGVRTTYAYDHAYRLKSLATTDSGGEALDAWSYTYDAVGNVKTRTDVDGHADAFAYDPAYRLTSARYGDGTSEAFTYDKVGNRLARTDETAETEISTFDAANQLLKSFIATRATDYTYDPNGNLVKKVPTTDAGGRPNNVYTYDVNNRLTQYDGYEGDENNKYAADGSRVELTNVPNWGTLRPKYDLQGNAVVDTDTGGTAIFFRVFALGVDQILGERDLYNSKPRYLHHDALGSVTLATDSAGKVVRRAHYRAFGTRSLFDDQVNSFSRYGFTGREMSRDTLYNYRSRYYDTSNGRFTSQDSYTGNTMTPPSLHRYTYVHNNPVKYVDPMGNAPSAEGYYAAALLIFGGALVAILCLAQYDLLNDRGMSSYKAFGCFARLVSFVLGGQFLFELAVLVALFTAVWDVLILMGDGTLGPLDGALFLFYLWAAVGASWVVRGYVLGKYGTQFAVGVATMMAWVLAQLTASVWVDYRRRNPS